ncbi:MAG: insulinase family protein, partial [Bacteroidales bacterium]|nr:insulinase family protein [Bacteroidales bacterium]
IVYTRTIREEEGGTYGVGTQGVLRDYPSNFYLFFVVFDTNKELYEKLVAKAVSGLEEVAKNGPSMDDLTKVLENKPKKRAEQLEENHFWASAINTLLRKGIDIVTPYDGIIKGITPEKVAETAKAVLNGYKKEVVQLPE